MNEQAQIDAMKAELVADGYKVDQDVVGDRLSLGGAATVHLGGLLLDLIGELEPRQEPGPDRPRMLVIEIANRTRPVFNPRTARPGRDRLPLEDEKAIERFKVISSALAESEQIGFQIRFLDVSADQAAARHLMTTKVKDKMAMAELLASHNRMIVSSQHRSPLLRSLLIARLWAQWLRIASHLYPGREHQELKTADLRTLQKELYDQRIIEMPPFAYRRVHRNLLAIAEGGDVEFEALLKLEPDVRRLIKWAALRYGVADEKLSEPEPKSIFGDILREVKERAPEYRRSDLEHAIVLLHFFDGTDSFPREVARFQLALGREDIVSYDLMQALLERASSL